MWYIRFMEKVVTIHKDPEEGIYFSKPEGVPQPTNEEEARAMIVEDISITTEGLMTLVNMADNGGYMDADKSAKMIVDYFTEAFLTKEEK